MCSEMGAHPRHRPPLPVRRPDQTLRCLVQARRERCRDPSLHRCRSRQDLRIGPCRNHSKSAALRCIAFSGTAADEADSTGASRSPDVRLGIDRHGADSGRYRYACCAPRAWRWPSQLDWRPPTRTIRTRWCPSMVGYAVREECIRAPVHHRGTSERSRGHGRRPDHSRRRRQRYIARERRRWSHLEVAYEQCRMARWHAAGRPGRASVRVADITPYP